MDIHVYMNGDLNQSSTTISVTTGNLEALQVILG